MSRCPLSQETINSFVDGEMTAAERERVFALAAVHGEVDREIAEVQRTKALLRHAYEAGAPARAATTPGRGRRWVAAAAVLVLGIGVGWGTAQWHAAVSPAPAVVAQVPAAGVVIQVSDGDPAKWRLAVEQALTVLEAGGRERNDVIVVANGPGLAMLRRASPVGPSIAASLGRGVRFVACGNTMQRENVGGSDLLPGVTVAAAGAALEILTLQRAGYAYIRI